ncbi:hypothetical protein BC938DRAFT_474201, partial [Jimgerdemannia flammicorona]
EEEEEEEGNVRVRVEAVLAKADASPIVACRGDRVFIYVNDRPVSFARGEMKQVVAMVREKYGEVVGGRGDEVNVEPSKNTVLFHYPQRILDAVEKLLDRAYGGRDKDARRKGTGSNGISANKAIAPGHTSPTRSFSLSSVDPTPTPTPTTTPPIQHALATPSTDSSNYNPSAIASNPDGLPSTPATPQHSAANTSISSAAGPGNDDDEATWRFSMFDEFAMDDVEDRDAPPVEHERRKPVNLAEWVRAGVGDGKKQTGRRDGPPTPTPQTPEARPRGGSAESVASDIRSQSQSNDDGETTGSHKDTISLLEYVRAHKEEATTKDGDVGTPVARGQVRPLSENEDKDEDERFRNGAADANSAPTDVDVEQGGSTGTAGAAAWRVGGWTGEEEINRGGVVVRFVVGPENVLYRRWNHHVPVVGTHGAVFCPLGRIGTRGEVRVPRGGVVVHLYKAAERVRNVAKRTPGAAEVNDRHTIVLLDIQKGADPPRCADEPSLHDRQTAPSAEPRPACATRQRDRHATRGAYGCDGCTRSDPGTVWPVQRRMGQEVSRAYRKVWRVRLADLIFGVELFRAREARVYRDFAANFELAPKWKLDHPIQFTIRYHLVNHLLCQSPISQRHDIYVSHPPLAPHISIDDPLYPVLLRLKGREEEVADDAHGGTRTTYTVVEDRRVVANGFGVRWRMDQHHLSALLQITSLTPLIAHYGPSDLRILLSKLAQHPTVSQTLTVLRTDKVTVYFASEARRRVEAAARGEKGREEDAVKELVDGEVEWVRQQDADEAEREVVVGSDGRVMMVKVWGFMEEKGKEEREDKGSKGGSQGES